MLCFTIAIIGFPFLQFENKSLAEVAALAIITVACVCPAPTKKLYFVLPFLLLIPYIIVHYDARSESQFISEKKLDLFWNDPIFSDVTNRGKILFMTAGFYSNLSRIQFLTGEYIHDTC